MTPILPTAGPALANIDAMRPSSSAAEPGGPSFADTLGQALSSLDKLQIDGDRNAERVALGNGNLHETALSLEKADTAMHLAVKVRNKLIDAYQEIMRMGV
ncbi:MAG TPA: flagellar hook-basal body complex protein FliE [Anaeromyxobacteraceae bacterium]|nr:flagellar hook-basal body complex protein FliE [Anaeromyxobacteraceae bacterium]